MGTLEDICKYHNEWVNVARSFGAGDISEDVVQDTYLKIDRLQLAYKICKDGEPSKGYMWLTIRSVYFDTLKQNKRLEVIHIGEGFEIEDRPDEDGVYNLIQFDKIVDDLDWYSKKMLKIYLTGKSMDEMSREIGIGKWSIYRTLKYAKEQIKHNYK